jgi:hypothetical protein
MIRDSRCWDRRTLKRGALHRKKLGRNGSNFTGALARSTQYLEKFCAELTHIWPKTLIGRLYRDQFGVDGEPSCNDSKSGPPMTDIAKA